jgi:toxin ParE1/3/4
VKGTRFSPAASSELEEIWEGLEASVSAGFARKTIRRLHRDFSLIERWPEVGRVVPGKPWLRRFSCNPYVIVYRVIESGIEIVRVVHGSRNDLDIAE